MMVLPGFMCGIAACVKKNMLKMFVRNVFVSCTHVTSHHHHRVSITVTCGVLGKRPALLRATRARVYAPACGVLKRMCVPFLGMCWRMRACGGTVPAPR